MQFATSPKSETIKADVLVVPACEEKDPLKGYAYGAELAKLAYSGDFEGKAGQSLLLPSGGRVAAARVLLLGLGKRDKLSSKVLGEALAAVFRGGDINSYKLKHVAVALETVGEPDTMKAWDIGRWCAEAAVLGSYKFSVLKTRDKDTKRVYAQKVTLGGVPAKAKSKVTEGQKYGETVAAFTAHCRDLVNEPSNRMTPADLAKFAQDMARKVPGLTCKVLKKAEIAKLKMGAFLGVNAGSTVPAHLILLEYKGGKAKQAPLAYVGKGLCFDSGGYNLKPSNSIAGMKMDMGGGAAAICALGAIASLKLPVNVVGVVPATENLISGSAYHPGSVLTSMSGQTIEIDNTDAEGRLILCDALTYTQRTYKPGMIVDMATLTGACIIAVGTKYVAVMGNDQNQVDALRQAFDGVGDNAWQLPLPECYDKQLDSTVADIKNVGGNPGTITAGLFLQRFIDKDQKWAHLDIAGACMNDGEAFGLWVGKSATGAPVRALVEYAANYK